MNWLDVFDTLDLNNQRVFYYEIQPIAAIDARALIDKWQGNLRPELDPAACQLVRQAGAICGLKQPRSKSPMDFNRSSNHTFSVGILDEHSERICKLQATFMDPHGASW